MASSPIIAMAMAVALLTTPLAAHGDPVPPRVLRPPPFSFDTLGHMVFAHITKSTSFNETDLQFLKKFSIVQFDKGQNGVSMPHATLEDRFIAAARQIKEINQNITTLMYLNALIDFTEFQRLYNVTRSDPSLLLHNTNGTQVSTITQFGTFDLRQEKMRELFVSDAYYGVASGVFDGVFIDRANWAQRGLLLWNGPGKPGLVKNGWDLPTLQTLVPAQSQLFVDLATKLGPNAIVVAKETGGGTMFDDWKVANGGMISDTFCSSYAPQSTTPINSKCASWSVPVRGHSPGSVISTINRSSLALCENECCANLKCLAVLYNTQVGLCQLFDRTYNKDLICKNNTGVEWLTNKNMPGVETCGAGKGIPFDAAQCKQDMSAVVKHAAQGQLTQCHGQGPLEDATQREFTMACFLIAAGELSYFAYASWEKGLAWSLAGTRWWPEYDFPLGAPIDPPMLADASGMKFHRRFHSGTVVEVDLTQQTASITWAKTK